MTNEEVAQALEEIADLLEIADEQFFRVRSYRRAAEAIGGQPEDVEVLLSEDRLTDISGIGEGIASTIAQLIETGTCDQREELLKDYPESLLELLKISGFGPKKAALVFNELDIATVDELQEAAAAQELQTLPGMGAKTEENILRGIANYREGQQRTLLGIILPIAEELIEKLRQHPSVIEAEIAGSARRRRETVHDLDVLVTAEDPAEVCEWFAGQDFLTAVEAAGETKVSGTLQSGDQVDLRAVPEESFGAALQYFTGSQQHNIRLRERAQRMGLTVNEYGVFEYEDEERGERVAGRTEQEVYEALDLVWIPPELREDRGEVAAAETDELPDLIELDDIRCDLQMHSTYSDGKATVEEMARTCAEIGYEYIGFTDHSESLAVANGLDAQRLEKQQEEIAAVNEKLHDEGISMVILHGIEADILPDGSVDIPDGTAEMLDYVIGALHQGFSSDAERITERMVRAVKSGLVDIIAHPTGRVLLQRQPYGLHIDELIEACADEDVALEINAAPDRLDLDDTHARFAVDKGCRISINTDSHQPEMLYNMRYGVFQARRGWITAGDVINTWSLEDFRDWIASRRT